MGITLFILGTIGLFFSLNLVYNPLNVSKLSMNPFTKKVTEHGPGLSWKWFWCSIQGGPIDMRSSIIVTSGGVMIMEWDKFIKEKVFEQIAPKKYETKDSLLYGTWATAIRPRKGKLLEFVLKTPQVGALMTMSEVDLTISDYLATRKTEEVLSKKKVVSDKLAIIFGGEKSTSPLEDSYGIDINNPKLFDLNLGEKSQKAAENRFEVV